MSHTGKINLSYLGITKHKGDGHEIFSGVTKKALTYTSFAIASILMILAFVTAKTYAQLGVAVIIYPLITYFAFKLFVGSSLKVPTYEVRLPVARYVKKAESEAAEASRSDVGISDIDKRAFLKIIGAAGVSFFIFSILGKRAESLLFDKALKSGITGPLGGSNPSDAVTYGSPPTEGYRITEIDDNTITYYGFTKNDGSWMIMREDTENNSFRYAKGDSNFPKNWSSRESIDYDYFYNLF